MTGTRCDADYLHNTDNLSAERTRNSTGKLHVNREHKSTVFSMLFRDKGALLSLYNALNGSHYDDPEKLEINTLENAIYLGFHNDLSFLLDSRLSMYEHQSTYNPNMGLRYLIYVSQMMEKFTGGKSMYASRLIPLPSPQFVVFYNGTRPMKEYWVQNLSEAFQQIPHNAERPYAVSEPSLELRVQYININPGFNEELKKNCPALLEYCKHPSDLLNRKQRAPAGRTQKSGHCPQSRQWPDF